MANRCRDAKRKMVRNADEESYLGLSRTMRRKALAFGRRLFSNSDGIR